MVLTRALLQIAIIAGALALGTSASAQNSDRMVALETTKGTIVMRIFYSMVPYTAGRFLQLASNGFYDGLTFHRVENWVIQGGDPSGNGSGVWVDPNTGSPNYLKLETNRALNHNQAGMVAMARNTNPNSASCQFYITKVPKPQLNGQYAVFGQVVNGASVVLRMQPGDRILRASIIQPGQSGQPNQGEQGGWGASGDESEAQVRAPEPPPQPLRQVPPPDPRFQPNRRFKRAGEEEELRRQQQMQQDQEKQRKADDPGF